jgi:hypothetical protein
MSSNKRLSDFPDYKPGWELKVNGQHVDGEWEVVSRFGSVTNTVVVGRDGQPNFDRPEYREAPNVNCVVWGRGEDGKARFAVICQPRPHADDPLSPDNAHGPVVFGQIVMGFLDKLIGKEQLEAYESISAGAVREASEESGATVIRNIEYPQYPYHNPNPTFVATWSNLVFVEVNLAAVEAIKLDHKEPIFSAEYVTASELRRRIAAGQDEMGAVYRMCTANSAWFIFFCVHPDLFQ